MAIQFWTGAELGVLAEWTYTSGTVSASTTQKNTGAYSVRINPSSSLARVSINGTYYRISFYLYIATTPTTEIRFVGCYSGSYWLLRMTTDRYIDLYEGGTKRVDGTTQLSTGTWYRISLTVNSSDGHAYYWIDGNAEGDYDGTTTQIANTTLFWGTLDSCSMDLYFDDIVVDNTASSTADLLGSNDQPYRCATASLPDTDKTIQFDVFAPADPGSGSRYTLIDDAPGSLSTTDYIGYADKSAVYIEFYYESCSDIGLAGTDVIDSVKLASYYYMAKDGDVVPTMALYDASANVDSKSVTDLDGAWAWEFLTDDDAPDEGGWDQATFDGLYSRWTHGNTASPDEYVANLLLLVLYHEAAGGGTEVSAGFASLTLTSYNPSINRKLEATTGTTALTVTAHNPIITFPKNVTAGLGSFTITTYNPSIAKTIGITAGTSALTITTYNPVVNKKLSITAGLGSLSLTKYDPALNIKRFATATLNSLSITKYDPAINKKIEFTANAGSLSITKYNPVVNLVKHVEAKLATLTITKYNVTIAKTTAIEAGNAALTITSYNTVVNKKLAIIAGADALSITDYDPTVNKKAAITAGVKALTITTYATTVNRKLAITATAAALAITAYDTNVTKTGAVILASYVALTLVAYNVTVTKGTEFVPRIIMF